MTKEQYEKLKELIDAVALYAMTLKSEDLIKASKKEKELDKLMGFDSIK